jgi:putative transposase
LLVLSPGAGEIHAQEDANAAKGKALQIVWKLRLKRLAEAAENGIDERLSYCAMPPKNWRCQRTTNSLEWLNPEIRRRTRAVGTFPDGQSALMLVAVRLRHVAATGWGTKRCLQMDRRAEVVAIA